MLEEPDKREQRLKEFEEGVLDQGAVSPDVQRELEETSENYFIIGPDIVFKNSTHVFDSQYRLVSRSKRLEERRKKLERIIVENKDKIEETQVALELYKVYVNPNLPESLSNLITN